MSISSGSASTGPGSLTPGGSKTTRVLLWVLQGVLALLFAFAGVAKLMMPADVLASQSGLSGLFVHCIAVAEVIGALGLILPGVLHIRSGLIPLAAAGLVIIMIGAVILTAAKQGYVQAAFPLVVGCLLVLVIWGSWFRVPSGSRSGAH